MSLQSISQTDTPTDSLVCIPSRVARQIVVDLEHHDLLVIENDSLKANIQDYVETIKLQEQVSKIKNDQINNLEKEVVYLSSGVDLLEQQVEEKEKTITKIKKQRNIAGGSAIGLLLIVLALL